MVIKNTKFYSDFKIRTEVIEKLSFFTFIAVCQKFSFCNFLWVSIFLLFLTDTLAFNPSLTITSKDLSQISQA